MIGEQPPTPCQQSYEDADEIQAGINQFQFHNIPLPQFSKVFEPLKHSSEFSFINLSIYNKLTLLKFPHFAFFYFFPHHIQSQDSVHHKITSQYIVIRITYGSSRDGAYH